MTNIKRACAFVILFIACISISLHAQEISLKDMPPVVVKTFPQSGDSNVDPGLGIISVTFSKDMADGSWSFVQLTEESQPKITGKPKYLNDKRTCEVNVSLEPEKTYAIWLNTTQYHNFKDTEQQPSIPYLLVFKTGGL